MFDKSFFEDLSVCFHANSEKELRWVYDRMLEAGCDVYDSDNTSDWREWPTVGRPTADRRICGIKNAVIHGRECIEVSYLMEHGQDNDRLEVDAAALVQML